MWQLSTIFLKDQSQMLVFANLIQYLVFFDVDFLVFTL